MQYERIVKTFYDELENGKILGRKCKRCGSVDFPPLISCNECSYPETEWAEISGDGELMSVVMPGMLSQSPENEDLMPYAFGSVRLSEGPFINVLIRGIGSENETLVKASLPLPVMAAIVQRPDYKTVVFDLANA